MTQTRRNFLTGLTAALATTGPALAQSVSDQIVSQLRRQGFTVVEQRRTLLGRVRLIAVRGNLRREIVFDPRNGTILRDYTSRSGGESSGGTSGNGSEGRGGGGGGGGGSHGDDDDDDDDDDDGDDGDDGGDDGGGDGDDGDDDD